MWMVLLPAPLGDQWLVLSSFILVGKMNLLPNQGKRFHSHEITRCEVSTICYQMNTSSHVNVSIKIHLCCVELFRPL